jgi:hypothetical protein
VSSRHRVSRVAVVITALALVFGVFAGTASAKKMSRHQKAVARHQLLRAIKKNPRLIRTASFLKKASLVDFKLPVTIRLRDNAPCGPIAQGFRYDCSTSGYPTHQDPAVPTQTDVNPNAASIDLGPSLGQRSITLGGTLPAEIVFHDSFDGGALGNVDINLLPGGAAQGFGLTSSSIPLLWNTQVNNPSSHWFLSGGNYNAGCGDFFNANAASISNPTGIQPFSDPLSLATGFPGTTLGVPNPGIPGVPTPIMNGVPYATSPTTFGLVGEYPGVDDITLQTAGGPGTPVSLPQTVNDLQGGSPNPFPVGGPTGGGYPNPATGSANTAGVYNDQNAVLRTGALKLAVAATGPATNPASGPTTVGPSGGQANLFGNIPGKSTQVDVTVSLATTINSILREVDPDPQALVATQPWTAQSFVCRQAWTGGVDNLIQGVHLTGTLRISPAIDRDGSLRIAKTILSSDASHPTTIGLAACLFPYVTYANPTGGPTSAAETVPVDPIQESVPTVSGYPQDAGSPLAGVACNAAPTPEVAAANVASLVNASSPYTTTENGSEAKVSGTLNVQNIDAEVLIGGIQSPTKPASGN